jgi:hypothetical protein
MSTVCANDRIWYAIVRRTPLHSSFGTDEANDGATVRRTHLHSSFGTDEANDGATVAAIVRTWLSYTLTYHSLRLKAPACRDSAESGRGGQLLVGEMKFRYGVIEMPTITIDNFMSSLLLNCVAFEQCHNSDSKHVTTYATFLDCLVNTDKDVGYLCDRNIIENDFGNDAKLARLINNLGKDVAFDINLCYLSKLFNEVHEYYGNSWHVQYASFKYTYFNTPWSFISAAAAFVLLVLAFLQTFFTIYPKS